jgi:hypothetical protein
MPSSASLSRHLDTAPAPHPGVPRSPVFSSPSAASNTIFALARAQADALPVIDQLEAGRVQIMEHLVQRLGDADALAAGLSRRDAADLLVAATCFAGWDQIVTARRRSPETATKLIIRMTLRAVT